MNIIVDKLSGFDRFVVPYEKSAYCLYNKSIIEIPDKLGIHLLSTYFFLQKKKYLNLKIENYYH